MLADIKPTAGEIARASEWVGRYETTTAALVSLIAVGRDELEDETGAAILEKAMREFAAHEETQL